MSLTKVAFRDFCPVKKGERGLFNDLFNTGTGDFIAEFFVAKTKA